MDEEIVKAIDVLIYKAKAELFKRCHPDISSVDITNEVLEIVERSLLNMLRED